MLQESNIETCNGERRQLAGWILPPALSSSRLKSLENDQARSSLKQKLKIRNPIRSKCSASFTTLGSRLSLKKQRRIWLRSTKTENTGRASDLH